MELLTILQGLATSLKATQELSSAILDGKAEGRAQELAVASNKEVLAVQQAIMQIQSEAFRLQLENQQLQAELHGIKKSQEAKDNYELVKTKASGFLYQSKSEPVHFICPTCLDKERRNIVLQPSGESYVFCPSCRASYVVDNPVDFDLSIPPEENHWP